MLLTRIRNDRRYVDTILSKTAVNASRLFSSSQARASGTKNRPAVCWLDLNGSGLSAIERLCLEEALLRHDPLNRSWAIVGTHDPIYSSRLKFDNQLITTKGGTSDIHQNCIIIMGIGGKPERLLNVEKVQNDKVLVIKRFSGGGTVVVDHSSLWTTFIGRVDDFPNVQAYPKDIMKWSADEIFQNVFEGFELGCKEDQKHNDKKTLVIDTKSCGLASMNNSKANMRVSQIHHQTTSDPPHVFPRFNLRENDYVLGDHKVGGNAQSIIKGGWLHHTSFLWDYDNVNMQYLTLPEKRPDYRGDRQHDDFLVKLKSIYGNNCSDVEGKRLFFKHVKNASKTAFHLEEMSLEKAMKIVENELGGFQGWFDGKCRTRIIEV